MDARPMKEHEKAKEWRLRRKLSIEQLSELTGYSVPAIYAFERGSRGAAERHSDWTLQRYRAACSGAERQIKSGRAFEW
jgi:transcriptional regulator with XRE-family HTH domain